MLPDRATQPQLSESFRFWSPSLILEYKILILSASSGPHQLTGKRISSVPGWSEWPHQTVMRPEISVWQGS